MPACRLPRGHLTALPSLLPSFLSAFLAGLQGVQDGGGCRWCRCALPRVGLHAEAALVSFSKRAMCRLPLLVPAGAMALVPSVPCPPSPPILPLPKAHQGGHRLLGVGSGERLGHGAGTAGDAARELLQHGDGTEVGVGTEGRGGVGGSGVCPQSPRALRRQGAAPAPRGGRWEPAGQGHGAAVSAGQPGRHGST